MNKITLIIVDPQYDFIEGGKLPVNGGIKALNNIVKLINSGKVGQVITTQDWHCGNHCSFIDFGGCFPEHCVMDTHGAQIYQPILDAIEDNNICHLDYYKGKNTEEFTAIKYVANDFSNYISFNVTDAKEDGNTCLDICKEEIIVVCGLAGDICVLNTLKALQPFGQLYVYLDGVASIDGGKLLNSYMLNNNIKEYNNDTIIA